MITFFLVICKCTENLKKGEKLWTKKIGKYLPIHDKKRKKMGDVNRNGRKQKTNYFL
jgi:hypothetical protein